MPDLVRLLEAAAVSEFSACRELIGLFSRRTIHMLNEQPCDEYGCVRLNLRPNECCTFVWSLGELGVKFMPCQDSIAYRRLHLIAKPKLPAPGSLSLSNSIRLVSSSRQCHWSPATVPSLIDYQLHGLLATKLALADKLYLSELLLRIERDISSAYEETDVCDLFETLGMLSSAIDEEESVHSDLVLNMDKNATSNDNDEKKADFVQETGEGKPLETYICERLLTSLAVASVEILPKFTCRGLLRILTVLCQMPFQSDYIVEAIEHCIDDGEKLMGQKTDNEDAIDSVVSVTLALRAALAEDDVSQSQLSGEQNGLKAILRRAWKSSSVESLDEIEQTTEQEIDIKVVAERLFAAAAALEALRVEQKASLLIVDRHGFELGQCREAIDQYRRIDFGQESRVDQQQRMRYMSKRLLSRLLP
jgi:hypothetical protein